MQCLEFCIKLTFIFSFINNSILCSEFYDLNDDSQPETTIKHSILNHEINRKILLILNPNGEPNLEEDKLSKEYTPKVLVPESSEDDQEHYYSPITSPREEFVPTPENTPRKKDVAHIKKLKSKSVMSAIAKMDQDKLAKRILKKNKDKKTNNQA